ncbi:MAG: Na/Pi cotransporter family protein [Ruminococcus sp.]|nr:Na/Pi cotransporter family protein [Ruminococcus sp.]
MDTFSLILTIATAFGGLALFIYGMSLMGTGLEKASGSKLEMIIDKMTGNVFTGVLLGVLVTAVIQSSSATTVIVVGLVNAGMMKLHSAIGVIMGANIGTTVTGQILRLAELDTSGTSSKVYSLLSLDGLIPLICIAGLICLMASKKSFGKDIAQILLGLGILFTGMETMTGAVKPLAELPAFGQAFATLENPILGVLVGAGVTAIIQSSSASVGILQAMSTSGLISYSAAFPIIMGQNIGTTITSVLSAVGTSLNARRAAAVHVLFNFFGTMIWLIGIYLYQIIIGFPFWDKPIDMGGIANFHTLFNVVSVLIFLPFTGLFEKLAVSIIRERRSAKRLPTEENTVTLDNRLLVSPSLAIGQAMHTLLSMANLAKYNFNSVRELIDNYSTEEAEVIRQNSAAIDRMEDGLNSYLVKITEQELTEYENRRVTTLIYLTGEFDRIAAYGENMLENAEQLKAGELHFSEKAKADLEKILEATDEIISTAVSAFEKADTKAAFSVEPLEETIDYLHDTLKSRHIKRLKDGECSVDSGVIYLDLLINLERIADHCSNIAVYVMGFAKGKEIINRHEYIEQLHLGDSEEYNKLIEQFNGKYEV